MQKKIYSAVFSKCVDEVGYSIQFYDIKGAITQGDTLEDGMAMAKEAIELMIVSMIEDEEELPEPTPPEQIELEKEQFIVPIEVNISLLLNEVNNRAIRKNVTSHFDSLKRHRKEK